MGRQGALPRGGDGSGPTELDLGPSLEAQRSLPPSRASPASLFRPRLLGLGVTRALWRKGGSGPRDLALMGQGSSGAFFVSGSSEAKPIQGQSDGSLLLLLLLLQTLHPHIG